MRYAWGITIALFANNVNNFFVNVRYDYNSLVRY